MTELESVRCMHAANLHYGEKVWNSGPSESFSFNNSREGQFLLVAGVVMICRWSLDFFVCLGCSTYSTMCIVGGCCGILDWDPFLALRGICDAGIERGTTMD
jgi:hypothetical protein